MVVARYQHRQRSLSKRSEPRALALCRTSSTLFVHTGTSGRVPLDLKDEWGSRSVIQTSNFSFICYFFFGDLLCQILFETVIRSASVRLDEVEGSSVTQETQPVESKRADDDDASNPIVVFASGAAPDYICGGVEVQNEMVTSEPRNLLEDEPLKVSKSEPYEGGKISVLNVACIMLGTPYKASFFIAVGLSGMGAGVIDTFLFIR